MAGTALEGRLQRWKLILLVSSIAGGFCGIVGNILGLTSLLGLLKSHPTLNNAGTILLVVTFPLIILAAHSLDKSHEIEKAITIESYRRTGVIE